MKSKTEIITHIMSEQKLRCKHFSALPFNHLLHSIIVCCQVPSAEMRRKKKKLILVNNNLTGNIYKS